MPGTTETMNKTTAQERGRHRRLQGLREFAAKNPKKDLEELGLIDPRELIPEAESGAGQHHATQHSDGIGSWLIAPSFWGLVSNVTTH
jgi:hypothetical protein